MQNVASDLLDCVLTRPQLFISAGGGCCSNKVRMKKSQRNIVAFQACTGRAAVADISE